VDTIDTSTGDTAEATDTKTSSGGKGGCAGGGDGSWLLGAALMALVAVRVRRSAKAD
jgi:MYXO-CTERM domain-containing protein